MQSRRSFFAITMGALLGLKSRAKRQDLDDAAGCKTVNSQRGSIGSRSVSIYDQHGRCIARTVYEIPLDVANVPAAGARTNCVYNTKKELIEVRELS